MELPEPAVDAGIPRALPALSDINREFWSGGAQGRLMIHRCDECARWTYPPARQCPHCDGALTPTAVSGDGTVFTYTVNHQSYRPEVPTPYVVALVELVEQPGLRLITNIVACAPDRVRTGMPVRVRFERHGEIFVAVFAPRDAG